MRTFVTGCAMVVSWFVVGLLWVAKKMTTYGVAFTVEVCKRVLAADI